MIEKERNFSLTNNDEQKFSLKKLYIVNEKDKLPMASMSTQTNQIYAESLIGTCQSGECSHPHHNPMIADC